MKPKIRVFLADDHAVLRDGIARLLADTDDLEVVGEASTGEQVLARAANELWDVLVLDLTLAGLDGHHVLRRLQTVQPTVRVLVLSMHAVSAWIDEAFALGATGFLSKGEPAQKLIAAIRRVAAGELVCEDGGWSHALSAPTEAHRTLSRRQLEILLLIAKGLSPSEIADQLNLRASTVSTHLQRLKIALQLSTNSELVKYAMQHGLVRD